MRELQDEGSAAGDAMEQAIERIRSLFERMLQGVECLPVFWPARKLVARSENLFCTKLSTTGRSRFPDVSLVVTEVDQLRQIVALNETDLRSFTLDSLGVLYKDILQLPLFEDNLASAVRGAFNGS